MSNTALSLGKNVILKKSALVGDTYYEFDVTNKADGSMTLRTTGRGTTCAATAR